MMQYLLVLFCLPSFYSNAWAYSLCFFVHTLVIRCLSHFTYRKALKRTKNNVNATWYAFPVQSYTENCLTFISLDFDMFYVAIWVSLSFTSAILREQKLHSDNKNVTFNDFFLQDYFSSYCHFLVHMQMQKRW